MRMVSILGMWNNEIEWDLLVNGEQAADEHLRWRLF